MDTVRRATGRRIKLSTLLSRNTSTRKGGTGCDAPRWWEEGRLRRLEEYCAQDVRTLVELVTRTEVRVGEHTTTRDMCVWRVLREEREQQRRGSKRTGEAQLQGRTARRGSGDGEEHGENSAATPTDDASDESDGADGGGQEEPTARVGSTTTSRTQGTAGSPTETAADPKNNDEESGPDLETAEGRPKRKRRRADGGEGGTYDETARRAPRRQRTVRYMARPGRGGAKRDAIQVGAAVVERTTRGRYEWRDGGLRPVSGARKRAWEVEARRAARQRT